MAALTLSRCCIRLRQWPTETGRTTDRSSRPAALPPLRTLYRNGKVRSPDPRSSHKGCYIDRGKTSVVDTNDLDGWFACLSTSGCNLLDVALVDIHFDTNNTAAVFQAIQSNIGVSSALFSMATWSLTP